MSVTVPQCPQNTGFPKILSPLAQLSHNASHQPLISSPSHLIPTQSILTSARWFPQVQTWGHFPLALHQGPSRLDLRLLLPALLGLSMALLLYWPHSPSRPCLCLCCFLGLSTPCPDPVTPPSPSTAGWVLLPSDFRSDTAFSRKLSLSFRVKYRFQRTFISRES